MGRIHGNGRIYSVDYMIGELDCIHRGFGKEIVKQLIEKIRCHGDAERIVVQPEQENAASCGLLLSCGFVLNTENHYLCHDDIKFMM